MDHILSLKMFNELLDKFFDYLLETFPLYKGDVLLSKTSLDLIRRGNPKLVVDQFREYVSIHKREIFNCNEDFFLNFDKNCNVPSEHLMYGFKLKGIWTSTNITERQKAKIWLYFQKLVTLSEKISN